MDQPDEYSQNPLTSYTFEYWIWDWRQEKKKQKNTIE